MKKPRKLISKIRLDCGCLQYEFQPRGIFTTVESEVLQCQKCRAMATVPPGNSESDEIDSVIAQMMDGPTIPDQDHRYQSYDPDDDYESTIEIPITYHDSEPKMIPVKIKDGKSVGHYLRIFSATILLFVTLCAIHVAICYLFFSNFMPKKAAYPSSWDHPGNASMFNPNFPFQSPIIRAR